MTGLLRLRSSLLIPTALLLLVSGCGFHLRGEARLPAAFSRTVITGLPSQGALTRALTSVLTANGVMVVSDPGEASAVLTLVSLQATRRLQTVSTLNQASSYTFRLTLVFKAHATKGPWRMPLQTLSVVRQYSLSVSQLQSQGAQERLLERSMSRELADLVLLRLQAFAGSSA